MIAQWSDDMIMWYRRNRSPHCSTMIMGYNDVALNWSVICFMITWYNIKKQERGREWIEVGLTFQFHCNLCILSFLSFLSLSLYLPFCITQHHSIQKSSDFCPFHNIPPTLINNIQLVSSIDHQISVSFVNNHRQVGHCSDFIFNWSLTD